ncbi:xanthine dehydrogenase family protein subunit M [Neorhizobium sp. S3-V5DH]|uniref:FAD binding domain-containing protein n=1 Tax=Neorhizobium sp. S3-V5DH TaxID=2485166 RepID=UPI00104BBCAF|nr:xanthine dehydrogenase family protein subunit M [Neorhizobium sp. S3-V5DH]TCV68641.1 carbon-monoxide dehydrogenase medium subunit [Neorhizobium sp. S3-V5DH]
MRPFTYHRLLSHEARLDALKTCDDAKYISGGMTLLPSIKLGLTLPSDLLDVTALPGMNDITVEARRVRIGAAVTHARIADNAALQAICPAFCDLARQIGDRHVRNRGTIGGSLANNDPAADYPAALVALDSSIETESRTIAIEDFLLGMFETTLDEHELVTAITFDAPDTARYEKFPHPASGYAMAGVFLSRISGAYRAGVTGASGQGAFRCEDLERLLDAGSPMAEIASLRFDDLDIFEDRFGSRAYRENLIRVLARRAAVYLTV